MNKNILKLYDTYSSFEFLKRENRFIVILKNKEGKKVKAYLPNPGRMEEYLIPGMTYYAVQTTTKIPLKVVSVNFNNEFVLLEPSKANDIYAALLDIKVKNNEILSFSREKKFLNSRFDFLINRGDGSCVTEVKSCTRFASGIAMFPDAPSERALKHLNELSSLTNQGYMVEMVYLVFSATVKSFVPDYHTDFNYATVFNKTCNISKKIYSLPMIDPVSLDLSKISRIDINQPLLEKEMQDKGSYLILLENERQQNIETGALGLLEYPKGYYLYIGKALNNLSKRVARLDRKSRKKHWHIDYITPSMRIKKRFFIRRGKDLEASMVRVLSGTADSSIKGFGSSDTNESSHLLFYKENPLYEKNLFSYVMKFRTEHLND